MLTGYVPTAVDLSQGVVARGRRGTSSATTTTELGVLRVDGITMRANRIYRIWTPPLVPISTVNGDFPGARLRYTTDGTAATTASTILTTGVGYTQSGISLAASLVADYIPSVDQTVSILLSVIRISGTGTVSLICNSGNPTIEIIVEDTSADVGNTGVVL